MKRTLSLLFLLSLMSALFSQDYKTGIGLRCGWISGLSVKHFVKEGRALEGIFSSGWGYHGYQITGLYELHKAAFTDDDVEGLFWFYGAGAHFGGGYRYSKWVYVHTGPGNSGYYELEEGRYATFGIDGILGMEYQIPDIPFTAGLDLRPFFEISNYKDYPFHFWDMALTLRYRF